MQRFSDLFGIPKKQLPFKSYAKLTGFGGAAGSGNSFYFDTTVEHVGADFSIISNATEGTYFIINTTGFYHFRWNHAQISGFGTATRQTLFAFTKNTVNNPNSITDTAAVIALGQVINQNAYNVSGNCAGVEFCKAGDYVFCSVLEQGNAAAIDYLITCAVTRVG